MSLQPTKAEAKWIADMKALARRRPKRLWLFSASGSLLVMRADEDGNHMQTADKGVDPAYVLDRINIPNDGGDW